MKLLKSTGLIVALVPVLAGTALAADPAEDRAARAIVSWGGKVTRDVTSEGWHVIGVDLGANQKVTDAGVKELKAGLPRCQIAR